MVDAVVSFVVSRLGDYIIREATFLGEVKNEVQSLKTDLEWMRWFIKDAEDKQVDNALIRQWVSDVRDIAYDSEDVLDKFMFQIHDEETSTRHKVEGDDQTWKGRKGLFTSIKKSMFSKKSRVCSNGRRKVNLYSIGKEIEVLKKRLGDVSRRRIEYGLENINTKREGESHALCRLKQLRKTNSFALEENVVGYEDDTRNLLAKLIDNEPRRFVISIWGTGGLGKTTLAQKLYHNHGVTSKFSHRAWVYVSQDYNTQDLLLRIIKSFDFNPTSTEVEKMKTEEDLERYLHKSLQGCSYLVVIDDVWHKEAWQSLKRAFPDNKNGSRVIITTRNKDVAQRSDERTHVHELRFLRLDEGWQLFCEKAFWNLNVDEALEKLGREMVEKCGGLPLAIVVMGGLLSTKKPQEWHLVRDRLWRNLSNDSIEISYLLALSFNDLPYQLKLCFLYLGYFPEDYEIKTEKLIRLWVAEGFVPKTEEIMEDVAYDNLSKLINRSLIQVDKKHLGRITTCRVHDLLRDLAIQMAKELNIFQIYDETRNSASSSDLSSSRRQAVFSGVERCLWLQQHNPLLRSLLFFDTYQELNVLTNQVLPMCTRFRFLRVLNFEHCRGSQSWKLPEDIGKLFHLKYLGLNDLVIDYVPPSILNLLSLETLDLSNIYGASSLTLPTEICRLQQLRHLIGNFEGKYIRIDNMTNLQTLMSIADDTWTKTNPEKLVNLRKLHVSMMYEKEKKFTFDSVAKLKSLEILSIRLSRHHFFGSLEPLSCSQNLLDLSLRGKAEKIPGNMHWILPNLQNLLLVNTYLKDDPMPALEKLPNLIVLVLGSNFYCGKKLICTAKGFPRLENLMIDVYNLEEWQVEEGAMPMLSNLMVQNTFKLRIPERFGSIISYC